MNGIFRLMVLVFAGALLCACNGSGGNGTGTLSGTVYGGQQPVSGSSVTLYETGFSSGGATVLATATTDANGNFILPSFPCSLGQQDYIVASGGNPGLGGSVNNSALHMMAALGDCATAPSTINIDEVTTVAAAYALNGFIGGSGCVDCGGTLPTDVDNVHGKDPGLSNAMFTAARLASVMSGTASPPLPSESACTAATPPVNCGAEEKLNALANSLAACVNTPGGTSSQCVELFDCATPGAKFAVGIGCTVASGVTPASDTLLAILYIARNPGQVSMAGVYDVATQNVVFSPALTATPTDWTLALNVTGGGLSNPTGIAIDDAGDVWTASFGNNSINEFSYRGTPLSPSVGYTGGGLDQPNGIAIDVTGNVWTASFGNSTVNEFSNSGAALSGNGYTGGGLDSPQSIAIDPAGNVWTASYGNTTVNEFNSSGTPLSPSVGYTGGGLDVLIGIAIDATGNVWITSYNNNTVNEFSNSGAALSPSVGYTGGGLSEPRGIAIDPAGNVWTASYGNNSVNELSNSGAALSPSVGYTGGGLSGTFAIAIDAAGNIWTTCNGNSTVNEFNSSGTPLSPSVGYTGGGLNGPEASSIAIDASGNVWVTNFNNSSLTELIGSAAPTRTPLVDAINQGFTP